jgi:O-antigen/teichoic acid export membrane protein
MSGHPDQSETARAASSTTGPTVNERMAKGAAWMVLARILDRGIGLASIVILARVLAPADFGLVATATAIAAMLELFGAFGFDVALIQNQAADRRHYDTAWTFNVAFGACLAIALLIAAVPTARFYADPRLAPVIACLALGAFIQGFENVGTVQFRKELQFGKEFKLVLAKRVGTFVVTVPLALALRSYWALVAGAIVGRLLSLAITYWVHEYRPRFSLAARAELFHFSKWLMATNFLQFLGTRFADLLIGKFSGVRQLGLFTLSYEIANLPTSELIAPVNRAVYPVYAKRAADLAALKRAYLAVLGWGATLVVPAGIGIATVADLMVPVALGRKWLEAIPVIAVLSINSILVGLKSNSHYVYLALGKPRVAAFLGSVQISLLLPMIVIGSSRNGALGVAVAYVMAQVIFSPISVAVLRRVLHVTLWEMLAAVYRPVIASAAMFACVRLLVNALRVEAADGLALLAPLLLCVAFGILTYAAALLALWSIASRPQGPEARMLRLVAEKVLPRIRHAITSGR